MRIAICDDHRLVLDGLRRLVDPPHDVVALATTATDLLALLRRSVAECLLLDLQMPDHSGIDLIPLVKQLDPDLRILIVTMHRDRVIADACFHAGADGFIPKDAERSELLAAVEEVGAGRHYYSPLIPKTSHHVGLSARRIGLESLTSRQEQIMLLLSQGRLPSEIARQLGLSPSTMSFHVRNLKRIMGAPTEGALLRTAVLLAGSYLEAQGSDRLLRGRERHVARTSD